MLGENEPRGFPLLTRINTEQMSKQRTDNEGLPASEQAVGLSAASPQPSASGLSASIPKPTLALSPAVCREIRAWAADLIGGRGMRLELALRGQGGSEYVNCLTPGDDDDGDLMDFIPWSAIGDLAIPTINGAVRLDFYVSDTVELRDNLMVEVDAEGIRYVWLTSDTPNRLKYTRDASIPA